MYQRIWNNFLWFNIDFYFLLPQLTIFNWWLKLFCFPLYVNFSVFYEFYASYLYLMQTNVVPVWFKYWRMVLLALQSLYFNLNSKQIEIPDLELTSRSLQITLTFEKSTIWFHTYEQDSTPWFLWKPSILIGWYVVFEKFRACFTFPLYGFLSWSRGNQW